VRTDYAQDTTWPKEIQLVSQTFIVTVKVHVDGGISASENVRMCHKEEMQMNWEYRTVKMPVRGGILGGKFNEMILDTKLNELGEQRWELVAGFATHMGYGQSRDIVAIFKREKR